MNIAKKIYIFLYLLGTIDIVILLFSFIAFLILLCIYGKDDKRTKTSGDVSLYSFITLMILVIILIILREKYNIIY